MNTSKIRDPKFWKRWYQSGAIRQPDLSGDDLIINGIGIHYYGPAKGYMVLSMGDRVVNSGPGWSVSEPVCTVVVPAKSYNPGMRLERLPGNAVPVDIFFSNT